LSSEGVTMKRIRDHLLALALAVATLGPALLGGSGAATTVHTLARSHVRSASAAIVTRKSAEPVALKFYPPCSIPGNDC